MLVFRLWSIHVLLTFVNTRAIWYSTFKVLSILRKSYWVTLSSFLIYRKMILDSKPSYRMSTGAISKHYAKWCLWFEWEYSLSIYSQAESATVGSPSTALKKRNQAYKCSYIVSFIIPFQPFTFVVKPAKFYCFYIK